jgi:Rps23 Pro-64 3,4-dihydroxylase Tpa1-like proline 4-hydroxylase
MFDVNIFNELKTKGYYTFELSNIDELNLLDKIHTICSNIKHTTAVHTGAYDNYSKDVEFETLEKLKEAAKISNAWQFWYQSNDLQNYLSFKEQSFIKEIINNILNKCYPSHLINKKEDGTRNPSITMFNQKCYINPHVDGSNNLKLCNILIYLNKDWKEGFGGELIVNNTKVSPTFAKVAVLDFKHVNPEHSVSELLDSNFKRYALITGVNCDISKIEYL